MSIFEELVRPQKADGGMDGSSREMKYDPNCGLSKEEFEWRCHQHERLSKHTPELMRDVKPLAERMRLHFQDNPHALKAWDEHEKQILHGFQHNLPNALASPANLPTAVRYEHLIKRKARSKTFVGMLSDGLDKFRQATNNKRFIATASFAGGAGLAVVALAVGPTFAKQWEAKQEGGK
ncbi:hypothetical protein EJB05_18455 [Eragrostis curvula]|uniref:Uncharacterized protein n=1 Tax=Eragrostis curvula TaxID=38414 RepID=A0A5J9VL70_9POAL|nr:hypothetical protein EJB05_18455 [Eragrostis curvula]